MRRIRIFDTTLRDGEQSPGVSLNVQEKLEIARQLERLGVDVIEAGFPVASPGDLQAVQAIAKEVRGPIIAALARANRVDIERAAEAVRYAARPRIHTFIATSDIHMRYKLRKSPDEVVEMAVAAVRYAKQFVEDVEFSAEDATRSDPDFLCRIFRAAIEAGATTINIPDTVGYTTPPEYARLIRYIKENAPVPDGVVISVHCHDDLGMAVANSLAAIEAGADQVEGCINGIGERAGNASIEEIVMALKTRQDHYGAETGIITEHIYRTSRLVSTLTGMTIQPNKAIVGDNAFAHESGIHQDGFLKERTTYEIMTPESVGIGQSRLVLGKHSGRHAFRVRLQEMGYDLSEEKVQRAYERFIELADRKKHVTDRDIQAIVEEEFVRIPELFALDYLHVTSGTSTLPTATVRILKGGEPREEAATGDGPVDAVYRAIDRVTGIETNLVSYALHGVTSGKDALGEVTVQIRDNGHVYAGRGTSTDVIEASARAYLQALNKLVYDRQRFAPAPSPAAGSKIQESAEMSPAAGQ
ncbi:MAG: 2-isopropylmalate synthase [Firmicutes bacterium]|nr:2-isopropylmalate synthase [Bacillota bacterium]